MLAKPKRHPKTRILLNNNINNSLSYPANPGHIISVDAEHRPMHHIHTFIAEVSVSENVKRALSTPINFSILNDYDSEHYGTAFCQLNCL